MTSFNTEADLNRNAQDSTERHVFGEYTPGPQGGTVKVQGNGTEDQECAVLHIGGTILHLPKGTNAEVVMIGGGDDTNAKMAVILGPRDKQYQSNPGEAWTQHPLNPNQRVGFSVNGVRIVSDTSAAMGNGGQIEVKGGTTYLRGPVVSEQAITVGGVPAFEA